jgi:hypothetical protein
MRIKALSALLLLTAVVVGGGFYFLNQLSSEMMPGKPASAHNPETRPRLARPRSAAQNQNGAQQIVYVTNQFHWSQIESEDYRKYIANLRAVGCPENTIKDIILTDVMKLYAARRGQLSHNGREFKYWETDEKRSLTAEQFEEHEKDLAAINKELPSVLRELLGINYERELNKYFVDTNDDERRLSFLPADKRGQLAALRDKYDALREKILETANGNPSAADLEALKKIDEQRKAELATLLNETEHAQVELAMSPTADRLRAELIGFNPNETEFRTIYELQSALDEEFAFANTNDESVLRRKLTLEKDIQDELRRRLGDARYAEYQRAQNPDFRTSYAFTEMHELPPSTAKTIFEIKQIAEAERRNLLANPSVAERDRWEALRAMQVEIEQGLRENLGTKTFSNYNRSTGKWVQDLTRVN